MSGLRTIDDLPEIGRVIAVVTIDKAADAVPLVEALCAGGVRVIEVTLRTPVGLAAIEGIAKGCKGVLVGAGTVRTAADLIAARSAGAQFAVSPGFTPMLAAKAQASELPWLPGVATASEILVALEADCSLLKFFPAETAGGPRALRAFASVFPDVRFCPTGGVTAENLGGYLELPNVACVGGTWLTPRELVAARDWSKIQQLAAAATRLAG